jgi:methyl-accepting chemotaxis protein
MKTRAFSKAILYHIQWKVRLRKFLNGEGSVAKSDYTSADHCRFGQWLCSDEIGKYASAAEIRELRKVHTEVMRSAGRVYELKVSGDDAAAFKEFRNMEKASMKLVSLLNIVQTINRN